MSSETLRPNAAGASATCVKSGCTSNWECVDEAVSDGDTTYCQCDYNGKDLHNIDNSALGAGTTINKVTLHAIIKRYDATYNHGYIGIKSDSTESWSDLITLPESWTEETKEYTTDPNTGSAWTVAAINALQIGYKSGPDAPTASIKCTQVYVVVDYTPPAVPKFSSDVGSGADDLTSLLATLTQSDAGSGAEALGSRALGSLDTGSGADAFSDIISTLLKSDSGIGIDAVIAVILYANDAGTGADALTSLIAILNQSDVGSGAEALGSRTLGALETGSGADALSELLATILKSDSGIGIDALSELLATILKSDSGAGVEALGSRLFGSSDQGAGIDSLVKLLVTIVKADSGVGVDTSTTVTWMILLLKLLHERQVNIMASQSDKTVNISLSQKGIRR